MITVKLLFYLIFLSWHGICNRDSIETRNLRRHPSGSRRRQTLEIEMKNKPTLVTGLLLAGLLAVSTTFADEVVATETRDDTTMRSSDVQRDRAKEANASAAEKAAEAVLADAKLDLNIRLIGPTSVKIAAER